MSDSTTLMVPDPSVVRVDPGSVRPPGEHERLRPATPELPDLADALRQLSYAVNGVVFELGLILDKTLRTPVIGDATLADILMDVADRHEAGQQPPTVTASKPATARNAAWHKRHRRLKGRRG